MWIAVNSEAFEAFRRQALEAYDHRRLLRASIMLVGRSLPARGSERSFLPSLFVCDLDDLDLSEDREYAVGSFKISDTRAVDRYRGRVLPVDGVREGAKISMVLTNAQWCVDTAGGRVHSIRCEGRVVHSSGEPYAKADVSIEFRTHKFSFITDELPERAHAGEFGYCPRQSAKGDSSPHFWFDLRHVAGDIEDFIIPMLTQDKTTQIVLSVTLSVDKEVLAATSESFRRDVLRCDFRVWRQWVARQED